MTSSLLTGEGDRVYEARDAYGPRQTCSYGCSGAATSSSDVRL